MEKIENKPKRKNSKVIVDKQLVEDAMQKPAVERQVIVHCHIKSSPFDSFIRIWRSTYLRDSDSSHKSKLLTAHNITLYPTWMLVKSGRNAKFTLVFSGLPENCSSFDLFEDIPERKGFYTGLISRNKTDVYSVEIYS